jgi:hypothetical protein
MKDPLTKKVEELGIYLYQRTADEDILIAQWWDSLFGSVEFSNLVAASAQSLSQLYGLFKPPNMMVYTVEDKAIESIHWVEPVSSSPYAVFFSSWSSPKLRGARRQAVLMTTIYELIFAMGKKTIIGITKQERLLNLPEGLGYVIVGKIPSLFDAEPAWIMYLDMQGLKSSRLYAAAQKILNKEKSSWVAEEKAAAMTRARI